MAHAYDLVGTLAEVKYPTETLTKIIYKPKGQFVIVTAQAAGNHEKLYRQVKKELPFIRRIYSVRVGTDKQEGQRKAAVLQRINAQSYTDNNANILDAIRQQLPDLELYIMRNGIRTRY